MSYDFEQKLLERLDRIVEAIERNAAIGWDIRDDNRKFIEETHESLLQTHREMFVKVNQMWGYIRNDMKEKEARAELEGKDDDRG